MRAVIVGAGDLDRDDVRRLDGADLVIAADGGAATLDALRRRPDVLIGDLDSVDHRLAVRLAAAGTRVERHPADKDASDLELALDAAIASGATEVVVLGALRGDRLDHELANVLLLADAELGSARVRLAQGGTEVRVLRGGDRLELVGSDGDLVTLLPLGRDAVGVTTHGLRWPLDGDRLTVGRSRGLSNAISSAPASVSLDDGVLLVVEIVSEGSNS
jgi:thiamine pyrophosphokinase